jgi:DNA-binding NarL/FixJ family response regulator
LDVDVVLLDLGLPDISGLQVARQIAGRAPAVAVVMISTQDSGDYATLAREHGARGFLAKADLTGAALETILRA